MFKPINFLELSDKILLMMFAFGIVLLKKDFHTKNKVKISLSVLLMLPWLFVILLSLSFSVMPQKTPETAFKYHNNCYMDTVINGEKSAIALNRTDNVTTISYFYKNDKGYKIAYGFATKDIVSDFAENKMDYKVEELKKTGERYIFITDYDATVSELNDCYGTEFYAIENTDINMIKYYGYIGTDDNYYFEIDGERIYPFKEKS